MPCIDLHLPDLHGVFITHRAWPSDTVLKRRRSVLFAFTFSPHPTRH